VERGRGPRSCSEGTDLIALQYGPIPRLALLCLKPIARLVEQDAAIPNNSRKTDGGSAVILGTLTPTRLAFAQG
jgi:hypothetical protein